MAELRRLLIASERFHPDRDVILLTAEERHYLKRVLRLRPGDDLAVVNGEGCLWTAQLLDAEQLALHQPLNRPLESTSAPTPKLGLAIVEVRRGMDDVMRMACELGIDCIQPLTSTWRTQQAEHRPERWQTILNEAVEQCERLWQPTLLPTQSADTWWGSPGPEVWRGLATTRQKGLNSVSQWLNQPHKKGSGPWPAEVWITIGPEGGWTEAEHEQAIRLGWTPIQMGGTILRTSTAAVAAATLMTNWRTSALEEVGSH